MNLGFHDSEELEDPGGPLQGSGKSMRHVKIKTEEELNESPIRK